MSILGSSSVSSLLSFPFNGEIGGFISGMSGKDLSHGSSSSAVTSANGGTSTAGSASSTGGGVPSAGTSSSAAGGGTAAAVLGALAAGSGTGGAAGTASSPAGTTAGQQSLLEALASLGGVLQAGMPGTLRDPSRVAADGAATLRLKATIDRYFQF